MYSEQLMREEGFDAGPAFRVGMYTDAIWRACRIILDVRMHRGELTPEEATDFLVEHTGFEVAEREGGGPPLHVHAGLPAELPAGQGADPRPARGRASSARRGLLAQGVPRHADAQRLASRSASTAACCGARAEAMDVIPAIDVEAGRSRVVYWPGASAGVGAPTDRPDRIAEQFVAQGARILHLVDFDGAQRAAPANLEAVGAVAARVAVPLQLAGGLEEPDHVRLAFAAGATRVVLSIAIVERPDALRRLPRGRRRLARRRPRPAAGPARRLPVAARRDAHARRARRGARGPRRPSPGPEPRRRGRPTPTSSTRSSAATTPTSSSRAASPTSTASGACATPA